MPVCVPAGLVPPGTCAEQTVPSWRSIFSEEGFSLQLPIGGGLYICLITFLSWCKLGLLTFDWTNRIKSQPRKL